MINIKIQKLDDETISCQIGVDNHIISLTSPKFDLGLKKLVDLNYATAKLYGHNLLNSLIPSGGRETYLRALQNAVAVSNISPILLEINSKDLESLPWELVFDSFLDRFLCLSKYTPIIRYQSSPLNDLNALNSIKLKVLVLLSSPIEHSSLNLLHEKKWLRNTFASFEKNGVIGVSYLENPVFEQVQELLSRESFHIIHFSGHAGFDVKQDQGYLLFEDEAGKSRKIYASTIESLFSANQIRFAFLNACKTASQSDTYGSLSVADSCIRAGIKWVVGMQQPISDQAALAFSKSFYSVLLSKFNILDAVTSGRQNIQNQDTDFTSEWATPVLISSTSNFQLVAIKSTIPDFSSALHLHDELEFSARIDKIKIKSLQVRLETHLKMLLLNEERRAAYGLDVPTGIIRDIEFHKNKLVEIQISLNKFILTDEHKSLILKSLRKRFETRTKNLEKLREIEAYGVDGIMKQVELEQEIEFQKEECEAIKLEIEHYS